MAVQQKLEVWSDLNPQLVTDSQGKLKLDTNVASVKGSIDNILRTSPGERIMLPEFALGLQNLLFEPLNDRLLNKLSNGVKAAIEIWDNRVSVEEVGIQSDPDRSTIYINLTFRIRGFFEVVTHTVQVNV